MPSTNVAEKLDLALPDETSPIPTSGTVPTSVTTSPSVSNAATTPTNATLEKEAPADKSITFHDIEALLNLAERLQESVFLKKQRIQLIDYALWMLLVISFWSALITTLILGDNSGGALSNAGTKLVLGSILTGTSLLAGITILAFQQMKRRARELLRRDEMALSDVADMLRGADIELRQQCSPLGQFFMRVQTWRLDIGVAPDPRIPRTPGIRPSQIPFEKIPPRP